MGYGQECSSGSNECQQAQSQECHGEEHCTGGCGCMCMGCKLLRLAKEAKINLLEKKMEEYIEKKYGAKLDKEAQIVVDTAFSMWKMKMEGKMMKQDAMEEYGKKLMAAMKD